MCGKFSIITALGRLRGDGSDFADLTIFKVGFVPDIGGYFEAKNLFLGHFVHYVPLLNSIDHFDKRDKLRFKKKPKV